MSHVVVVLLHLQILHFLPFLLDLLLLQRVRFELYLQMAIDIFKAFSDTLHLANLALEKLLLGHQIPEKKELISSPCMP